MNKEHLDSSIRGPLNSNQTESYPHPMLQYGLDRTSYGVYLKSLLFLGSQDGKLQEGQRNYLSRLATAFGFSDKNFETDHLNSTFLESDNNRLLALLDTEEKKIIWMLDGAVVLGLGNEASIENNENFNFLLQHILMSNDRDYLAAAFQLPREKDATLLWDYLTVIGSKCPHWKHVVDFLGLTFSGAFTRLWQEILLFYKKSIDLSLDRIDLDTESMEPSFSEMKTNLEDLLACLRNEKTNKPSPPHYKKIVKKRKASLTKLQNHKKEAISFLDTHIPLFTRANNILSFCGIKTIEIDVDKLRSTNFDVDCSTTNDNWHSELSELIDLWYDTLTNATDVGSALLDQLLLFEEGNFKDSAEEIKKKKDKESEAMVAERMKETSL